jgi:hypothetical protein
VADVRRLNVIRNPECSHSGPEDALEKAGQATRFSSGWELLWESPELNRSTLSELLIAVAQFATEKIRGVGDDRGQSDA